MCCCYLCVVLLCPSHVCISVLLSKVLIHTETGPSGVHYTSSRLGGITHSNREVVGLSSSVLTHCAHLVYFRLVVQKRGVVPVCTSNYC